MQEREGFQLDRLRLGEWIIGASSLLLLIDLMFLPWFGLRSTFRTTSAQFGIPTSATGWQAFDIVGPLVLITCLLGIGTWYLQASRRSPSLPVCATVITTFFAVASGLALVIRVVFDPPAVLLQGAPGVDTIETLVPAVLGWLLSWLLVVGTWISLRQDGIAEADAPQQIETLQLKQRPA